MHVAVCCEAQGAPRQTPHPGHSGVLLRWLQSPSPAEHGNAAPQALLRPLCPHGAPRAGQALPRPAPHAWGLGPQRVPEQRCPELGNGPVPELRAHLGIRKLWVKPAGSCFRRASAGASAEATPWARPEAPGGLAVSPQGCGQSRELPCAAGKQLPLPSLQPPAEELQHRQESVFLPFPSALKQRQTRLKAAKTSRRNQNKSRSLFPIGNLPRSHL